MINDNLFVLKGDELIETDYSILVHNYHYKSEPKMAYVIVITKKGFSAFLESMLKLEDEVEQKLINIIKAPPSITGDFRLICFEKELKLFSALFF